MEPLLLQMLTIRAFDDDSRPNGVLHEGIRQGLINGESRAIASAGGRREHHRSELDELFNHGGIWLCKKSSPRWKPPTTGCPSATPVMA